MWIFALSMFKGQHHESRKSLSLLLTLEHAYCKKSQLLRGTFCFTQVQGPNALTTLLHLADEIVSVTCICCQPRSGTLVQNTCDKWLTSLPPNVPQAVCPIDSAAVKGITAQQVMYVRPGEWYRRPSMCFVVDLHVTTAVLIHLLGGHLLVDDTLRPTLASWSDIHVTTAIHQLGGQHHLVDDTLTLSASWSDIHVKTAIHQLGGQHHLVHYAYYLYLWGEHHFGGATRTLPTWADVSFGHTLLAGRWYQAGDTRIPLPRKSLWTPQKIVDCKVGLCTSLRTVAKFL